MPLKFKNEEVQVIIQACEGHLFEGIKPDCLTKLSKRLTLSGKEFRDLVRYLKNVAMTGIQKNSVGSGLNYRKYLLCAYNAMRALDICNSVKMAAQEN